MATTKAIIMCALDSGPSMAEEVTAVNIESMVSNNTKYGVAVTFIKGQITQMLMAGKTAEIGLGESIWLFY